MAAHQVNLDLGIADVHAVGGTGNPSPPENPAAVVRRISAELLGADDDASVKRKQRIAKMRARLGPKAATPASGAPDRRKRVPKTIHIRADIAPGGALHVRHMSDRTFYDGEGILLAADAAPDVADKPVWVQIAKQGAFAGHPSGPFRLDEKTFDEIIRNFRATENRVIPWDFEHASEMPATEGSIPERGAPAQGWITDLKIEGGDLYGLTNWGELAREYIHSKKYRFCSPAIRFGSKDRVTGKNIGARLTSVALTNEPFLDGMQPLAAKDGAAATVTMMSAKGESIVWDGPAQAWKTVGAASVSDVAVALKVSLDRPMHSPHEYMPKLKAALKLAPLATHAECADTLARVRDCCMKVGVDGMHDGERMSDYTGPLRDLVGASPGMTGVEFFEVVEDLIAHAMEQHVEEMHPGGAQINGDDGDDTTMDAKLKADLDAANTQVQDLTTKLRDAETKVKTLEAAVQGQPITLTLSDKETPAQAFARTFKVTLKAAESAADFVTRIVAENAQLLDDKTKREEADIQADVDLAFATYKDERKLTDAQKPALLRHAKRDREGFHEMYPPVPANHQHLLSGVVPPEPKPKLEPEPIVVPTYTEEVRRLMSEEKMTLSDAQEQASRNIAMLIAQKKGQ